MDSPNTKHNHIIYSLQQSEDQLVIQDNPYMISFQQEHHNTANLHEHLSMVEGMGKTSINLPSSNTRKRAGNSASFKATLSVTDAGRDEKDDQTQKKMVHREIERQRRQEMSTLYSSLPGLLPIEFVKGNRSVSDHMTQAVHYIKQKEGNVKELSMERDRLKRRYDTNESAMNRLFNTVSVNFCNGGVNILINSCSSEEGFPLSQVLNILIEEGLNIVSCSSTKVNDRLVHSIQSEVCEQPLIDPSMLQQRLVSIANTPRNFN